MFGGEQSNTSAAFDERFILKLFRRVTPGVNPDFEIGRLLTEREPLPFVPQVAGAVEYHSDWAQPMSIAVLHEFVPNVGDAWTYTLDELGRYFEHVQSLPTATLSNRDRLPNPNPNPRTLNPRDWCNWPMPKCRRWPKKRLAATCIGPNC